MGLFSLVSGKRNVAELTAEDVLEIKLAIRERELERMALYPSTATCSYNRYTEIPSRSAPIKDETAEFFKKIEIDLFNFIHYRKYHYRKGTAPYQQSIDREKFESTLIEINQHLVKHFDLRIWRILKKKEAAFQALKRLRKRTSTDVNFSSGILRLFFYVYEIGSFIDSGTTDVYFEYR